MELYIHLISIIFFGFYGPTKCQEICEYIRDEPVCCSNYRMENGKCVACPHGSYGLNCSEECPIGLYGEFCEQKCNCAQEICDISFGCSDNSTEVASPPAIETELTTRILQTTDQIKELQDDESNFQTDPLFLYLVSGGCASLFCAMCFLVICRRTIHTRGGMTENDPPLPQPPPLAPDNPHHGVANVFAEAYESDYAEIRECNPTYSSCAEASSEYNVLSFSRSKYRCANFNTSSAIYSTSESCSLQKEQVMSLETKSDETDNTQPVPIALAADTDNQTEEDDVNITQEKVDSADLANHYIA